MAGIKSRPFSFALFLHATPANHGILGVTGKPFIGVGLAFANAGHNVIRRRTGDDGFAASMRLRKKARNQNELGHARLSSKFN
jgi:hypothetical protein